MIYHQKNTKLVEDYYYFKGRETFTGVVKDKRNTIVYYLNGKYHREDGPAIIFADGYKEWCLNGESYGWNDEYTNESWIRFITLRFLT